MPMPLHIFEPRYLEMIEHCRAGNAPFGIVLIRSGAEVGGEAAPFSVGTLARVSRREAVDGGRLNIVAIGEGRFQIVEILRHKSYLTAKTEPVADRPDDPATLAAARDTASQLFRSYVRSLYSLANRHVSGLQIPTDPAQLSYAIANAVQIPLLEKQRLLEYRSTQDRLRREIELLSTEVDAHEFLCQMHSQLPDPATWEISPINPEQLRPLTSRN
jgi:Lon protease-like protein